MREETSDIIDKIHGLKANLNKDVKLILVDGKEVLIFDCETNI